MRIHISDLFQFIDNKSLADWLDVEEVLDLKLIGDEIEIEVVE